MRYALALGVALCIARVGSAAPIAFTTTLSGPAESPPNTSPGTGTGVVTIDPVLHSLFVSFNFSDLTTGTTASHIHCCTAAPFTGTAGVATQVPAFVNFPLGVTSGSYTNTFDLTMSSSWNPTFISSNGGTPASAEATLLTGLLAGEAYLNVHTTAFPNGEIRGFLTPVPEPTTALLFGGALIGIELVRRRRFV
jgi:hypothetical protein